MEYDKDLKARQEARTLAKSAQEAQKKLREFSQSRLDAICQAISQSFWDHAEELARLAVEETGFGNAEDKTTKNRFASRRVWEAVRDMKTVGILNTDDDQKVWEVAVPKGVIAAIVPSTNPTSTVCYKAIVALKAGNAIVFSPHPKAMGCTLKAVEIVCRAAEAAGAPKGAIASLTIPSLDGCRELMYAPQVDLILATGGPAMVKAAYSTGKPAIGVGAGNGPAYLHPSADMTLALKQILTSKTFDNGTVCASEQSIILERPQEQVVISEAKKLGFYFMNEVEAEQLRRVLFRAEGGMNPGAVGKNALVLAKMAGFPVPHDTKILVAREEEAGTTRPYSMEKLCPVLAFYVMENQDAVLEKVTQILSHEGAGHTFVIHCAEEAVIRKFALKVPVSRFLVNAPGALGGIGAATHLFPALTLGCGSVGGSSSSNNISPLDLLDIRRVAWGVQDPQPHTETDDDLVELITAKILERLNNGKAI